ncbi:Unknown protein, partial [Striga hermonthica]
SRTLEGDENDAEVARQLKNAASRVYHARKRLARATGETHALEQDARTERGSHQPTGENDCGRLVRGTDERAPTGAGTQNAQATDTAGTGAGDAHNCEARAGLEAAVLKACRKAWDHARADGVGGIG